MSQRLKPNSRSKNQVRIIGGSLRGRRVEFPDRPGLRPTSVRIRETLFNWLQADIAGARCLDLFAGSGALAIEALSRGASEVDLVDADRKVCDRLRDNLRELNLAQARVHQSRALDWIQAQSGHVKAYQLVFLDPPYDSDCLPEAAESLHSSGLLADSAMIYLEHASALSSAAMPADWVQLKAKKAGQVYYYLYTKSASEH
jgi:16S rRNA (guanine966-N2)-methyltransferase